MFAAAGDRPGGTPANHRDGSSAPDRSLRGQVQQVRLDLLAQETERLDRRLAQILDQQKEDRRQREDLKGELANLCRRVDKLIAMRESDGGGGGDAGDDLRDSVKPLLQAVLQMLDGPAQTPGEPSETRAPVTRPPANAPESRRPRREAEQRASGSQVVTSRYPQASPPTARPGDGPATPGVQPDKPQMRSGTPEPGDAQATADALHKALSRLDLASRSAARARPAEPIRAAAPRIETQPEVSKPAQTSPARASARAEASPAVRRPETRPRPEGPTPKVRSDSWDEEEESLGVEDPAIEIARLLRPVEARRAERPVRPRPGPTPRPSETPKVEEPGPLQLGTAETPEIAKRPARLPERLARPDVGVEKPAAPRAPGKPGGVPPAAAAGAPRQPTTPPSGAQATGAATGTRSGGTDSASKGGTSLSGGEPSREALPRCLTEPWDDADSGRWRLGRDTSLRRWPFRRNRAGGEAADRNDASGSTPETRRTRLDRLTKPTE